MTATVFTYNGVTIGSARFRDVDASAILDDSRAVQIGVQKTMTVEGVVQNADSADFVADLKQVQADLLIPRKRLIVTTNGESWVDIRGSGTGGEPDDNPLNIHDIATGPIPSNVKVRDMYGGRASFVSMTISWTEPPDSDTDTSDPVILSHRFAQQFGVGENELSSRVTTGTVIFNGKFDAVQPDAYRQFVIPRETAGYRRTSLEFVVSSDEKSLAYRCIEVEGYRPYPQGILKAEMAVTLNRLGGLNGARQKSVQLRLEADKHYPKAKLIERAWDVLGSRVDLTDTHERVMGIAVTEDVFGGNSIRIECQASGGGGSQDSRFNLANTQLFGPVGSSPSTLEQNGRFRQLNPYGQSLVYAAVQGIFQASADGRPALVTDVDEADVDRFNRTTNLFDTDGDGYKEDFTQDGLATGGDRVDVTAAALPDEYDGSALDIFIGPNDSGAGGSDFYSEEHSGVNYYSRVSAKKKQTIVNNWQRVPVADPSKPDRYYQPFAPTVVEVFEGEMWRIGAQPEFIVPDELAEATRTSVLRRRVVDRLDPRPLANGSALEYGVRYRYELERVYNPDAGDFETSRSMTLDSLGSSLVIEYDASQGLDMPEQPMLASGVAIANVDPSLSGAVYA